MEFHFEETLLYVEDLSVSYDDNVIIKDINITEKNVVRSDFNSTAQIIAVVGRSGRGKSTFFKALTGLVTPKTGKILIRDFSKEDINAARPVKEGDIGFVDQKYTLFRHKTVKQTFEYALRKSNLPKEKIAEKIADYASRWGLTASLDKYPNELSGGQRQRTAIIEQLFSSDKYIVLDEPFSGLDVGNIAEVKKTFDMLSDDCEQNTILFSTHDIKLAIEISQCIYVIGQPTIDGKRQDYGTIVAHYDLREMGICWKEYCEDHQKLYDELIETMMNS
jgi:polar amino acid transport system ATP-binding protein